MSTVLYEILNLIQSFYKTSLLLSTVLHVLLQQSNSKFTAFQFAITEFFIG
jgi:hypothetical protein